MKLPHLTQHGTRRSGDSLDLFADEAALLRQLVDEWDTTVPERADGDDVVPTKWDHGTVGKLLLEHAAVRLAAGEDLARVLEATGRREEASRLNQTNHLLRPILDQMYDTSRGVQPISVAITPGFIEAVEQLKAVLRPELTGATGDGAQAEWAGVLGPERARLRSATFIRKHAPARPGRERHWYDRVPVLRRVHAAEDRLRGFPWAESSLADQRLAQRYDGEV